MTMTASSFIIHAGQGLNLDYDISIIIGAIVTILAGVLYIRSFAKSGIERNTEAS
jgi:hypothetical protein